MAEDNFKTISAAEALGQLLGEENGAMLAAGAAEGNHQILEATLLVAADARIHE
jgi:hypothetical protein